MEKTVLTVEEMGTMLNLSRSKAYELVHSEASPPVIRIGRCIYENQRSAVADMTSGYISDNSDLCNDFFSFK